MEIVDRGFHTNDYTDSNVRIYNYLPNKDFDQDYESSLAYDYENKKKIIENAYLNNYGGNEITILRIHDALRNYRRNSFDYINVLEHDFIKNHAFKKEESIRLDNESLHVISFSQTVNQTNRSVGTLFISKTDYAIHKLEYTAYNKDKRLPDGKLNRQGSNREVLFEVIAEYKRNYGSMYPSYVSFFNSFKAQKAPTFVVKDVSLNISEDYFKIDFNDLVDFRTANKDKNYDLRFEGKKIRIDRLTVFDSKVYLYPKTKDKDFDKLLIKLNHPQFKEGDYINVLEVKVTKVKNRDLTAIVNQGEYKTYRQYREFFVQEVKPKGSVLTDTLFMNKNVPIFKNQPMLKPDNFDEFWMNTPLKNVDN